MIRFLTSCASQEEFVATYRPVYADGSIFLGTEEPYTRESFLDFALVLQSGEIVMRGSASVSDCYFSESNIYGQSGMRLRLLELDELSTDTLELLSLRSTNLPPSCGSLSCEVIEDDHAEDADVESITHTEVHETIRVDDVGYDQNLITEVDLADPSLAECAGAVRFPSTHHRESADGKRIVHAIHQAPRFPPTELRVAAQALELQPTTLFLTRPSVSQQLRTRLSTLIHQLPQTPTWSILALATMAALVLGLLIGTGLDQSDNAPRDAKTGPPIPAVSSQQSLSVPIVSTPAGATVRINGDIIGKTPLVASVRPSQVTSIELRKRGYRTWTATALPEKTGATVQATLKRHKRRRSKTNR